MEQTEIKRGPGRPPKETSELAPRRAMRKPFGALDQKLAYAPREGYHRHWFNDVPGRIERALEAGYEHVTDREGKKVVSVVGTAEGGGPLQAFLMEIPQEWYDQDMAVQQAERDKVMAQIKEGKLEAKDGDNRYIPSQGIKITAGR